MSRRKRRIWSIEEKLEICAQTRDIGVSVALVARRYAVNANLIHKWLRDPLISAPVCDVEESIEAAFLPVEIEAASTAVDRPHVSQNEPPCSALCAIRVDFTLSDGRRVLIEGPTSLRAVLGLVGGLAS